MSGSIGSTPRPSNPDVEDPRQAAYRRADREGSEYSWGEGLTPNPNPTAGPDEGGRYSVHVPGVRVQ